MACGIGMHHVLHHRSHAAVLSLCAQGKQRFALRCHAQRHKRGFGLSHEGYTIRNRLYYKRYHLRFVAVNLWLTPSLNCSHDLSEHEHNSSKNLYGRIFI